MLPLSFLILFVFSLYFPYMSIYRFINFIELLKESAFGLLFFSIFPPIFYFIVSVLVFILPIV